MSTPLSRRPAEMPLFRSLSATGPDWRTVGQSLVAQLADAPPASTALMYVTDSLGEELPALLTMLRRDTPVATWAGCTAIGIMIDAADLFEAPAASVLLAHGPEPLMIPFDHTHGPPRSPLGNIALIHANPMIGRIAAMIPELAATRELFLVGGLASARNQILHFAGEQVQQGPYSGLWLDPQLGITTGLSQGCQPIGPVRTVDAAKGPVIEQIDGRPALDVLKEDVGELLARDLKRIGGYILAAIPVSGSDTGDYLVRNLLGLDAASGRIAVGEEVAPGESILFVRRDHAAAVADLERMVRDVIRRAGGDIAGAVYVSCLGRGPNMMADGLTEPGLVQRLLGEDVPLVGFYANGEISNDRLYGYTGVLTVFTGG